MQCPLIQNSLQDYLTEGRRDQAGANPTRFNELQKSLDIGRWNSFVELLVHQF